MKNKTTVIILIFAFTIAALITEIACKKSTSDQKVIVLGLDGLDYQIVQGLIAAGKLPNYKKLRDMGTFSKLETSIPPQSPVAWSNFITGMNPGGHGIFDFLHRNPENCIPFSSLYETVKGKNKFTIGDWVIPLTSEKMRLYRKGTPFWTYLEKAGIPTTIFKIPVNFPPDKTSSRTISGMGTPDILGTMGMYSYYTDNPPEKEDFTGGKVFTVDIDDNVVECEIFGPKNSLKVDLPILKIPFKVYIDTDNKVAKIVIQDQEFILKEGEWSEWKSVEFEVIPHINSIHGICLFYMQELNPDFKLYVSPINIDPDKPALPITNPKSYAKELFNKFGYFYTETMAEDSKALNEELFDDEDYIEQSQIVLDERLEMFDYELDRLKEGLLFFYFSTTDLNQHMLWRNMDSRSPLYDPQVAKKLGSSIIDLYILTDTLVDKLMKKIDDKTTIFIMSDHGFSPYYRFFNLNSWLYENGYTALIDPTERDESEFFMNVDWNRTKAYGSGFNSLFINEAGREKKGIVQPGYEKENLMKELKRKLLEVRDPENNKRVISNVYFAKDVYTGDQVENTTDLIIGYNRGYKASSDSVLGAYPYEIIGDNMERWSADHCLDYKFVPAILFCNKPIKKENPALYDLPVSILDIYGIKKPEDMVGKSIFK